MKNHISKKAKTALKPSEKHNLKIFRYWKNHPNATQKEIGEKFGRTGSSIKYILNQHIKKYGFKV